MKYREQDTRTYRPLTRNLAPWGASETAEDSGARPVERRPTRVSAASRAPDLERGGERGQTVHVWTDGACSGNPGPMGIGIVVVVGDRRREHGEYLGKGTNNIAELTAIRRGLEIAAELAPGAERPIRVYTDSSYAIGLLSQGWKAKANQSLVAELREFLRDYSHLRMVKVEGHAGVPENERCDLLARQAVARNRMG